VWNQTQFQANVGHLGDEAPTGHVRVSGNDTAIASATFRQLVEQTFTSLSVDFGVIVVQGERRQKRLRAIQDGLVPLELHREDATPISPCSFFPPLVAREACDPMRQSEDCATSVQ
jgi:hypothetical protein